MDSEIGVVNIMLRKILFVAIAISMGLSFIRIPFAEISPQQKENYQRSEGYDMEEESEYIKKEMKKIDSDGDEAEYLKQKIEEENYTSGKNPYEFGNEPGNDIGITYDNMRGDVRGDYVFEGK